MLPPEGLALAVPVAAEQLDGVEFARTVIPLLELTVTVAVFVQPFASVIVAK